MAPRFDEIEGEDVADSAPRFDEIPGEEVKAPPQVGPWETFLNKTGDAIPLVTPVANAAAAGLLTAFQPSAGARLTPEAARELDTPQEQPTPGLLENYRSTRDRHLERTSAGSEQNPVASGLGTATGTAMSLLTPMPKVALGGKTATVGQRIGSNALTGAGYGALNSATNGKADLTKGQLGQLLKDVIGVEGLQQAGQNWEQGKKLQAFLNVMGAGALGGGLTGGALSATGEGVRATGLPQKAGAWVKEKALNTGRRVLTDGADQLSTRQALPPEVVEESIRSGAVRPFGTTKGASERLGKLTDEVGSEYANIITELEARGVKGPDARKVADELLAKGAKLERHTMNDALPKEYLDRADQLLGKAGPNGETGLKQAEDLKRSLQEMAKYARVEETPVNVVKRDIASTIRRANEEAIDSAAKAAPHDADLQKLAGDFVPVKQRLGKLIQAEEAAKRGAARGAQRNAFSLTDNMMAAAGLSSGNPLGLAAAAGNNLLRSRGRSTGAAYGLGLADLLTNPGVPGRAGRAAEVVANGFRPQLNMSPAGAMAGGSSKQDELASILATNPEALGKYGPAIQKALEKDPETAVAFDFVLQKQDPEYARRRQAALAKGP